ncbi:MAG TPA: DUF933 domain-containing protein, partial [Thermodesulfobacteriota bacterium]|nr:DUF933 domain-containing protein [Thermodesulfobacteriota bacterium]
MKLGLIGKSQSGKDTLFDVLTKNCGHVNAPTERRIGTIAVPDSRVDVLTRMYQPRKTTYAQVEYFLPGAADHEQAKRESSIWTQVRACDGLIQVVRNFHEYGGADPTPVEDFVALTQELILADLLVIEKRLERLTADKQRGRSVDPKETALLTECRETLESEMPLRSKSHLASHPLLRGYTFLSAKPTLVLFNNDDDCDDMPDLSSSPLATESMVIKGKLEHEIAGLSEEEAAAFMAEFDIQASARERVIEKSYELLGLVSFFTVGEDEVRAWTIARNTDALDAAEVIHSDIKKGFIRA